MSKARGRSKTHMEAATGEEGGTVRIEGDEDERRTGVAEVASKEDEEWTKTNKKRKRRMSPSG